MFFPCLTRFFWPANRKKTFYVGVYPSVVVGVVVIIVGVRQHDTFRKNDPIVLQFYV